jgi:zinc protease
VLGNRADVENVPIERLQAFYRTWYQPDNATVIVAGRFDPQQVIKQVDQYFGRIPKPARTLPGRYTVEPAQDGEREITIRRAGELPMLAVGYHTPAITHPDSAALDVLDSVLGSVPSGRLHQVLVKTKLAADADSGAASYLEPGLFSFFSVPTMGTELAVVEKTLLAEVEAPTRKPFTQEEVDAAKQRLDNRYVRASSNVIGTANGLSDSIAAGDWRLWFLSRSALAKVTVEDVNRVAATYLVPANRTIARFIPTKEPVMVKIDPAPGVADLLKGYVAPEKLADGEVFDGTPQNIQARTETVRIGDKLKLAMLPKRSRGDEVTAYMMFHYGDDVSTAGRAEAGSFAGSMITYGTPTMTREQIAARFDAMQARVSISGSARLAVISITSKQDKLIPAMRLAAEVMRNPTYPEAGFEEARARSISALESGRHQPGMIVDDAMRDYFDPWPEGHPDAYRTPEQRLAAIKALKVEDVRAFHRDFFGTAEGEIAVVGRFDPVEVKREVSEIFAGWKSAHPFKLSMDPYYQPEEVVRRSYETPDKANAVVVSRSNFEITVEDPDHAALLVAARIFGSGSKGSRLGDRVREQEGLSYYVGGGVIIDPVHGNGKFYMQATSAPENMGRVETAMQEELQRFVRDGVTATELEDAKSGLLKRYEDGRSTDGSIAGALRLDLFMDRTMQWTADFEDSIRRLTVEQVNAAIKRRIDPWSATRWWPASHERCALSPGASPGDSDGRAQTGSAPAGICWRQHRHAFSRQPLIRRIGG